MGSFYCQRAIHIYLEAIVTGNQLFFLNMADHIKKFLGPAYCKGRDHYIALAVCGALCALIGMLGDLSASVIKRQQGVKDFGTIMPGHGGVLDRFDSVLFVVPFFYLVLQVVRFVTL